MQKETFLVFDIFNGEVNNSEIIQRLKQYGRLRDYYIQNSDTTLSESDFRFSIYYILANLAAQGINATLIGKNHPSFEEGYYDSKNSKEDFSKSASPRILQWVPILNENNVTVNYLWKIYYENKAVESPTFIANEVYGFNFAYCAIPTHELISNWEFGIFAKPFDKFIWVGLLFAINCVSLLAFSRIRNGFCFKILSTLSALLDNELGLSWKQKSKLSILWLLISILIVNLYRGEVTSSLIQPYPETRITTFSELEQNNKTLVYEQKWEHDYVVNAIENIINSVKAMSKNDLKLWGLLKNVKIAPSTDEFYNAFTASNNNLATINYWMYAIDSVDKATKYISLSGLKAKQKVKCYLGKEYFQVGETFLTFIPPGSKRLARVYERLKASGITSRLQQEHDALWYSSRVQDRVKVKGRTSIDVEDYARTIIKLKMEGRTLTIFLLWTVCLGSCGIWFILEILCSLHINKVIITPMFIYM